MTSTGAVMEEYLISSYPLPPSIVKQDLSRDHSPQITSPSYPANKSRSIDYERVLVTTPNSGLGVYDVSMIPATLSASLYPLYSRLAFFPHSASLPSCSALDMVACSICSNSRLHANLYPASRSLAHGSNCSSCNHARAVLQSHDTSSCQVTPTGVSRLDQSQT